MKMKFVLGLLTALLFNAFTSGILAETLEVSHLAMFGVQTGLSLLPLGSSGCLLSGLNKEIWIPDIIEKFYAPDSFLTYSKDLSMWVDNNKLNLQEAGVDPEVYIDNEVYPIPVAVRTDIDHEIVLKHFDTENTVHIDAIEIEESAGKRQSVTDGHRNSLRQKFARLAAFNWAPIKDGDFTPVTKSTGGANIKGYKSLRFEDILAMETRFDELEIPVDERVMSICPQHLNDLRVQDMTMYKALFSENKLWTFKVTRSSFNPIFNGTSGVKKAWNSAVNATDAISSLAYHEKSVARAQGTVDMFSSLKDPVYRGDVIGFNMRGVALPVTGKYIGAIISPKA